MRHKLKLLNVYVSGSSRSNAWHSDYDFTAHPPNLKEIYMELTGAKELEMEWTSQDEIKISADNNLPSRTGNEVSDMLYKTVCDAAVATDGMSYSSGKTGIDGRNSGSNEVYSPLAMTFHRSCYHGRGLDRHT